MTHRMPIPLHRPAHRGLVRPVRLARRRRRWTRKLAVLVGVLLGLALVLADAGRAKAESLSYDAVYALAAGAIGPGPGAHYAARIARCESRFDAGAHSAGYDRFFRVNYSHVGLYQVESNVWGPTTRRLFGANASLFDPWVNTQMMAVILKAQGWNAWPYCSVHA